jgi:hypothetical protein
MKNIILLIYFSVFFFNVNSQVQPAIIIDKSGPVHPWNNLNVNNNPNNFQFAIVTDRTGGHRAGVFEDAVKKLNLLQPEFVMSVGDLIEGYTLNKEEIYTQWDEFNGFIDQLQMPFFYVPGNHDYINEVMANIWKEKYGKSYYHFVYNDVLFLCLNSEEALQGSNFGGIEKPQYEYIKQVLKQNQNVKWTLVFMHQPLWILDNTRYWKQTEDLLKDRDYTVFAGHHHHYVKYQRNNQKYFLLATTGGFSKLRGPDFGEFDHLVWVTMTDNGPIIANLLLEGIWDENVVDEQIAGIVNSNPLRLDPLILESNKFSSGVFKYKIVNDANLPMKYSLEIANTEPFFPISEIMEGYINPNSVLENEFKFSSEKEVDIDLLAPSTLLLNYEYELPSGRVVKSNQETKIAPVYFNSLAKSSKSKKIDAHLQDWTSFPFFIDGESSLSGDSSAYLGNEDVGLQFAVEYDENYLYIAAKVKDDEIILDPALSAWRQDALRIYLDARPYYLSSIGKEEKEFEHFTGFFFSPGKTDSQEIVTYKRDKYPEGTKIAASYSNNELYFELAVPVSYLNDKYGKEWQDLRLNIAYNDVDMNGSTLQLWWKPEWRSEKNYIGSGLFRK